ncbi:ABC transporter permease [Thalassospira sp.]|uniref:ABC transporter permease n=1 Tax=Thalassospira sp. TaxID=1912094 RepID=UPI002732E29F|nr:ABC transporter permease [Thalassospira sp.]MDP2697071.1 ABC transporter permease [Thalassospira sp.]
MKRSLENIYRLGVKELFSLRYDVVLLILIVWSFSFSIWSAATGMSHDLNNAAIAIVDEDRSQLSSRITDAFLPPYFNSPARIAFADIDPGMDGGEYTFVVVIPSNFEADILAGNKPDIQVNIDATAMMQAGIGATYISSILAQEISLLVSPDPAAQTDPIDLNIRYAFNPNVTSSWFTSVMQIINNVTMLSIVLTGAALIREREHGTIEHLLVMPLGPFEIMMAKVWANGLVILVACAFSLLLVVELMLRVPIAGSEMLFFAGTALYLFFATALGIFLATLARSMPQFGLLFMLVILPMQLLSGSNTPLESQPQLLQTIMQAVPSTHYVSYAQAILYRGAGIDIVWPQFALVAGIGGLFFIFAALRFRQSISVLRS